MFKNTSSRQTVAKNTMWLTIGEIVSRVLKLGVFVYAARIIGVHEWGTFSYGLALIATFSILSDIGVNSILQREVAKKSNEVQQFIITSFYLKIGLSFLSALLLLTIQFYTQEPTIHALIPFVALMLFIDSMREFGFALHRAFEHMEIEAAVKIGANALLAAIALFLLRDTPTAQSLMIAYILASIISLLFLGIQMRPYVKHLYTSFNPKLIKHIFIEAWPIGIVAVFGTILGSIDTIILGMVRDASAVGYYAAAQKPVQILWLMPGLMSTALLPFFSRIAKNDDSMFRSILGRAITACLICMIPLVAFTIIFARQIITLLYGATFVPAAPLLAIIAISAIAAIPSIFLANALLAQGKQKLTISFVALGAISNITLSLILIPLYGIYGAAIAYTFSQIIANVFIIFHTRKVPALRFHLSIRELMYDLKKAWSN